MVGAFFYSSTGAVMKQPQKPAPPQKKEEELPLAKVKVASGFDATKEMKDAAAIAAGERGLSEVTILGLGGMTRSLVCLSPEEGGGGRWKAYY
jgi:hypothetical protein